MKSTVYLIADRFGVTRMTKRWPSLGRDEIAVEIKVTIPDGAFKSPVLSAVLDVVDGQVIQPTVTLEAMDAPVSHEDED